MKLNPFVSLINTSIILYKNLISPIFPRSCRFYPSCSEYVLEAFRKYGFIKGSRLALRRLARCHPLCTGGYDPIN